jgi:hypothetical protein
MPLIPNYMQPPVEPPVSARMATSSMVWGILSVVFICLWPVALLLAIAAVSCGRKAQTSIRNGTASGAGMARAGMICGTTVLIIDGCVLLISLAFYIASVTRSAHH